jgi:predicted transposase YdaD
MRLEDQLRTPLADRVRAAERKAEEKGREMGREEGREMGREEGEREGTQKVLSLLRQGHTLEEVERMVSIGL